MNGPFRKHALLRSGLILIFLFHAINNVIVVSADTTPFIGDASDLYKHSIYYFKLISASVRTLDFQNASPLFHLILSGQLLGMVTLPFYALFGISHDAAVAVNLLFFLVLLLSVYGIGALLFSETAGFLAALIISLYPSVFGFSRVYMLEFAALALSALSVFFLIKSEGFRKRAPSLFCGIAVGLGVLLRPRFVVGIVPPFLYCIILSLLSSRPKTKAVNMLLACLACGLVILPWYSVANIKEYFGFQDIWSTMPSFTKACATIPVYVQGLFTVHLRLFFSLVFLCAAVFLFLGRFDRKKTFFLFTWLVCSLVLVASFGIKDHLRLELFLCVPVALISSAVLEKLEFGKTRRILLCLVLAFGVAQYAIIVYGKKAQHTQSLRHDQFFSISDKEGLLQARTEDWRIDQIVSVFDRQRNFDKNFSWKKINPNVNYLLRLKFQDDDFDKVIKVLYVQVRGSPIGNEIDERIVTHGLPLSLMGLYPDDFDYKRLFSPYELRCMVLGADYVIVFRKTPGGENKSAFLDQVSALFSENAAQFEELKDIRTPWGDCVVYGKNDRLKREREQ